jgi:hypothetical protein
MQQYYHYLGYGSHVPVLLTCLHLTKGPVLEMGAGFYSTALLSLYSGSRYCRTIESNFLWLEKVRSFFPVYSEPQLEHGHDMQWVESYNTAIIDDRLWEIALIDQEEAYRKESIRRLRRQSRLIILHDTENPTFENSLKDYRYYYDFKELYPYTSVASETDNLDWLKESLQWCANRSDLHGNIK